MPPRQLLNLRSILPSNSISKTLLYKPTLQQYSTNSTAPKKRTLVDLGFITLIGVGISGAFIYNNMKDNNNNSNGSSSSSKEGERTAFTVPVLSQTGAPSTKTLTLLNQQETNNRLTEHEASYSVSRRSNPVFRYDINNLPSNSPIEDDSCTVILERDPESLVHADLMFFGVFDGHSGWQTSRLLSSTLVSYIARELDLVFRSSEPYTSLYNSLTSTTPSTTSSRWSLFSSSTSTEPKPELDLYDPIIQQAMKNAFLKMDDTIVNGPIRLLEEMERDGKVKRPTSTDGAMSLEQTNALNLLLPALSGSCALLAFLDVGRNKLHVACTGDSRAVMGTWEPNESGSGGKWRAEALSEDQTGKNLNEVKRIQALHPPNEAETVISRGRILGGLEPSRAFGDSRYKWPIGMQEKLGNAFHPGSVRGRPRNYLTPPYVTAIPEVVSIDLSKGVSPPKRNSLSSFLPVSSTSEPQQATRFIVLATDGLYDRLSNSEVVSLVGAHLSGLRGPVSRSTTLSHLSKSSTAEVENSTHVPREDRGGGEEYIFEDGNLSTHLIRNALGGAKREQVSVLLSIPAPLSRKYRDDITVTVILLGAVGQGGECGSGGVHRREEKVKSKL